MTYNDSGITTIDSGLAAIQSLIDRISKHHRDWNEADTRFQFINPFITDCLGWPRNEIALEQRLDRTYTDYELGYPRAVIWEAKKEGVYFELPANPNQNLISSLKSIMALDQRAAEAIQQVQSYCSSRGTPVAVVCNGHQLIAFLASRQDGLPPLEGRCLVINGHQQFVSNFPLLWQNLSPAGVKERRIVRLLTTGVESGIPKKLSSYLITDTRINNVLYLLPEVHHETDRKWRGIGAASLARLGSAEERAHAGGSSEPRGRGPAQRTALEGGGA